MIDNADIRYATRILRTHDLMSGEELLVAYFPRAGVVTINGYSVTRSQKNEDLDEKAVFHQGLGNKKYTVSIDSLIQLYV